MTQVLLQFTEIGAVLESVPCIAMAQGLRSDPIAQARPGSILLDYLPHPLSCEPLAAPVEEESLFALIIQQVKSIAPQKTGETRSQAGIEGNLSAGADTHVSPPDIDVSNIKRHQLAYAKTGPIKQFEHNHISLRLGSGQPGRLGHQFPEFGHGEELD